MSEVMSQSEVRALLSGQHVPRKAGKRPALNTPKQARGRSVRRQPGEMNKLEAQYADELAALARSLSIEWWAFEPVKLKLADRTYYTPDFCIMHLDGTIEFVETKGFWEDDARVKIKVAARLFPMFKFTALKPKAKKAGGGWDREDF